MRNNYQVEKYETILNDNGIKTIIKEGVLGQQKVFSTIYAILNILNTPQSTKVFDESYATLCANGFYDAEKKCRELWDDGLKDKLGEEWTILSGEPIPVEEMTPETPWISTHAEVFDIKAKTLYLVTREEENDGAYDFKPYKL